MSSILCDNKITHKKIQKTYIREAPQKQGPPPYQSQANMVHSQNGWLAGCLAGWLLAGWLACWLAGWLPAGWLLVG